MEFAMLIPLVIIWFLIALTVSYLNKIAKKRQEAQAADAAAVKKKAKAQKQPSSPKPAAPRQQEAFRPSVMQPTITITEHDDSIYQGSMNAETGEGYDPCHDEQLSALDFAEAAVPAAETAESGLWLGWSGSEIVQGIVMSEILKRKTR